MNLHEYQAKNLLRPFGIPLLAGACASTPEEAAECAKGSGPWVVKAQVHAGGRGKAGGIKLAQSREDVYAAAQQILGMTLVTPQTKGQKVYQVYVEQGCTIAREIYLSLMIDRSVGRIVIIASAQGGVDIETVAKQTPEAIVHISVDPLTGICSFHAEKLAEALNLPLGPLYKFLSSLYLAFTSLDMGMLEINPLVITPTEDFIVLDAKMSIDDSALFRQPEIKLLHDATQHSPTELKAQEYGLNYVQLEGNIGCVVNGAGLAMATVDIIHAAGGKAANFIDVGGDASKERVLHAFELLTEDPKVEGILVNIFGSIVQCDIIAQNIIAQEINCPLVVRLEGKHAKEGKDILGPIFAQDLRSAAESIVSAIKGR